MWGIVGYVGRHEAMPIRVDDLPAYRRVPVLASIPHIVTDGDTAWRHRRFSVEAIATAAALGRIVAACHLASGNGPLTMMLTQGG